jgi:transposase
MKKNIIPASELPELTIGLDLSDRSFQFCELNAQGEIVNQGQLKLDRATLRKYLASQPKARVALETGGQSAWVKQVIEELGHEAVVANARELEAVTGRSYRTDHHDAQQLARLARVDRALS